MDKTQSDREETEEGKAMSEKSKSEIFDKYKDIAVHFSKVEWAELCEWEKIRFKNVKRNYEAMLEIGFNVPKPEFMSRRSRGSQPRVYESSDSDEDWTPKPLVKNPPQMRIFKSPFKSEDTKKTKKESTRKTQKARSQMASRSEEDKAENRRYSLRNRERTVYTEERELGDDDYLFCEDCETFFIEECSVHGPPVFIKDTVVEVGQPDRARLTVPEGLSIAISKIRNAGLGVWNEGQVIPKAIHFGPYEGTVSNEEAEAASGYSWVISKSNKDVEYIDAKDESTSNWMRFVNCARNEEEQNLVAFQHCGQIYYRTCKSVPPRCELLVWYGDEYAEELGIKWPTMSVAKQEPTSGQRVLRDDSHPCPHCSVAFATADFLHKHIRRHLEFSGQTSAGAFHLDQQIHTGERPHQCTDCGQSFAQAGSLRTHQRIHTGERPYKCSQCGQSFAQAGNLQTHQRIHTGERPFKCSQCGQSFAQAGHLQTHQQIHTGERPFKCLECGQSFTRAGNLQRHQRIHTGERPFKCLECGQSFARTGHLQTHQRVHTGERPYKCSQCRQSFARTGHLQTHQRVHTGERPYKCSQCGKSFVYSYQLKAHTCFETCRHCGNVFNDSTAYKVHMRNCMET